MKNAARFPHPPRRLLLAGCVVLWSAAFVFTHIPITALPRRLPSDKLLHSLGYLLLTAVFLLTMFSYGIRRWRRAAVAVCAMMIYAGIDEITQEFVNRYAALNDWLADTAGALAATLLFELTLYFRAKWLRPGTG